MGEPKCSQVRPSPLSLRLQWGPGGGGGGKSPLAKHACCTARMGGTVFQPSQKGMPYNHVVWRWLPTHEKQAFQTATSCSTVLTTQARGLECGVQCLWGGSRAGWGTVSSPRAGYPTMRMEGGRSIKRGIHLCRPEVWASRKGWVGTKRRSQLGGGAMCAQKSRRGQCWHTSSGDTLPSLPPKGGGSCPHAAPNEQLCKQTLHLVLPF